MAGGVQAKALFDAGEVNQRRFVVVAAPIGTGYRAQLNIYEQRRDDRPCFSLSGQSPVVVDPLLSRFDFTGICSRYIDGNGYSLRVGGEDMSSGYRISVVRENGDNVLMAYPANPQVGPEMVVARTGGHTQNSDYLLLVLEPGWTLKRRQFNGRNLGHIYLYRASFPAATSASTTESRSLPSEVNKTPDAASPEATPTQQAPSKPESSGNSLLDAAKEVMPLVLDVMDRVRDTALPPASNEPPNTDASSEEAPPLW